MAKKISNVVGAFARLRSVGSVVYSVCYDPDEFQNALDSYCDERGCNECKYFTIHGKNCNRPSLVINFKPFEK